jgi:uncharacterized protein involved in response to NO
MYGLVRRFIKTGIVFLGVGLVLGSYMLIARELFFTWPHPHLVSAHVHAVLVGFVMFMILGVGLWLFPRPEKGDERYRPERIEAAYWILLLSTTARFAGEVGRVWVEAPWIRWLVVLSGLGQAAGLGFYFWTMWTRIRPVGSHIREAKGERF